MIDNFSQIDKFLNFEPGTFYKFEALIRNTDGQNALFPEGYSNRNKNILIKSWYIDNAEYYNKIKQEMINLCNITGARLYVTLDRKDILKLMRNLVFVFTDALCNICYGQIPSIKKIQKMFASETSKIENSCKDTKTIMFDVDTKDEKVKEAVITYLESKKQIPIILETKKGYHIVSYRKFNMEDASYNNLRKTLGEDVSVEPNQLGLVYHPMKQEIENS